MTWTDYGATARRSMCLAPTDTTMHALYCRGGVSPPARHVQNAGRGTRPLHILQYSPSTSLERLRRQIISRRKEISCYEI